MNCLMEAAKTKYLVLAATFLILFTHRTQSVFAQGNINYCNSVQNKVGLIRHPLGTIALSTTNTGDPDSI
jgi:hypothetical protein